MTKVHSVQQKIQHATLVNSQCRQVRALIDWCRAETLASTPHAVSKMYESRMLCSFWSLDCCHRSPCTLTPWQDEFLWLCAPAFIKKACHLDQSFIKAIKRKLWTVAAHQSVWLMMVVNQCSVVCSSAVNWFNTSLSRLHGNLFTCADFQEL